MKSNASTLIIKIIIALIFLFIGCKVAEWIGNSSLPDSVKLYLITH